MATEDSMKAAAVPPFDGEGKFLRSALHTHSTVSDGSLEPRAVVEAYARRGFDVVVMTDHRKLNDVEELSDIGPLVVSGMELHPPAPQCGDSYHLVAVDLHEETDHARYAVNDIVRWANDRGAVVFTCHPYWCGRSSNDLMLIEGSIGVEVYNHGCEVEIGRGLSRVHWDEMLERKGPTFGLAVDDGHSEAHIGGGWVNVSARERTVPAFKEALREGRFYSSTGPEVHGLSVEPAEPVRDKPARKITVKCSPARRVVFCGPRWRGRAVLSDGEPVTEASPIWTDERYLRVEVVDEDGRTAWTNALFLDPDPERAWRLA